MDVPDEKVSRRVLPRRDTLTTFVIRAACAMRA